ncbi:DNA-binding protein [Streptomyces millisiae]|uniref:DNA-binding protein n=1 Tax=Streptomyces millisiae TaxID=3075542 RepID=A0ABU2LVY3_9ACTN|nr:DNA-binding protein [Streptomyces sp. DSM 44918]MDT0321757.1 DNA-binding protein [Streptomyces sp. DSM 44918]
MTDLRAEIEHRLRRLLTDPESAGDTADWAMATMEGDAPELEDETVWNALDRLGGADLKTGTGTFLHGEADFRAWLTEFQDGVAPR